MCTRGEVKAMGVGLEKPDVSCLRDVHVLSVVTDPDEGVDIDVMG